MLQNVEDQKIILQNVEKVATMQQEFDVLNIESESIQKTDENFNATNENIVTYFQRIMRNRSEILFISSFIRENTFEMIENQQIESIVDAFDVLNTSNINDVDEQNNNEFHLFFNEKDYALTLWFHESIYTKKDVDRFFKNKRLFSSHEDLSYSNDEEWLRQLDKIFFDIQSNTWMNAEIKLNSAEKDKRKIVVHVQYQDIIQVIRFLIEHKSFETNLTYASVRQYNDNDERIYNEMHINIWWWERQKQLSEKTIIIFLIIITNKTMLIEHHDDKATWSMYLIIDNLNRNVRRNQNRSRSVLFDFISIIKSSESSDKIRIWHYVISLMFKRKFTFIFLETWFACSTLMSLQQFRNVSSQTIF